MKKVIDKLGEFRVVKCCCVCDWYKSPEESLSTTVCPKCGGKLRNEVGRFVVRMTSSFWIGRSIKYLGFVRKNVFKLPNRERDNSQPVEDWPNN